MCFQKLNFVNVIHMFMRTSSDEICMREEGWKGKKKKKKKKQIISDYFKIPETNQKEGRNVLCSHEGKCWRGRTCVGNSLSTMVC